MALSPCPECQKDVSDKAPVCPHCGVPLREVPPAAGMGSGGMAPRVMLAAGAACLLIAGAAFALTARRAGPSRRAERMGAAQPEKAGSAQPEKSGYALVEQLRAEQDAQGTRSEHVRQRFFRLYNEHPGDPAYIYLWGRVVDDPQKRLEIAEQGIKADPRFSWNYNLAARALAQLDRVKEAYDDADKGAALDPGNMQLADKKRILKIILDHKLMDQTKIAPNAYASYESKENFEKGAVRYQGLFRSALRGPDRADVEAMAKSRLADVKDAAAAVRGIVVCQNPYSDKCIRAYVARETISDAHNKVVWMKPDTNVATLKQEQVVTVAGAVVTNARGDNIVLADAVTVEAR
jgi:hypothetical protein